MYPFQNPHVKLDIKLFGPEKPPFVPIVLKLGVNLLEERTGNWEYIYAKKGNRPRAKTILNTYLSHGLGTEEVEAAMEDLDVCDIAYMVKGFLSSLDVTPLGTGSLVLARLAGAYEKRDDQALYKSEVDSLFAQVLAHLSSVALHTSCFMMIHLLHIWEYSSNPLDCRQLLGEIFGPLLLGSQPFSEPVDPLEVLLDIYDSSYWFKVSGCQMHMRKLFRFITPSEFRFLRSSRFIFKDFLYTPSIQPNPYLVGRKPYEEVDD